MHISRLQFKAEGPNFNAELIPVHSPLLRESCLVSYPPLTYMLKFSGFADLTSCQGNGAETPMKAEPSTEQSSRQCARRRSVSCSQGEAHCIECIKGTELLGAQKRMSISSGKNRHQQHETEDDTEVGMLSGVSRKRRMRSNPCWFTEFCKSQCLSHFAAPFIVVRAETSVAESCEEAFKQLGKSQGRDSSTHR